MKKEFEEIFKEKIQFQLNPGIYFLFNEDEIVYVGQAMSPKERISHHFKHKLSPGRMFDSYSIIRCDKKDLNKLENYYILKYTPRYNKTISHTDGNIFSLGQISPKTYNQTLVLPCAIIGNKLYIDLSDAQFTKKDTTQTQKEKINE